MKLLFNVILGVLIGLTIGHVLATFFLFSDWGLL